MALTDDMIFYTTEDVANMLRCSIPVARHTMKRADFPLVVVGKNFRVSKAAFNEWATRKLR